jgi:signal transduction histidine kinase/CheY-like chemotaxis protein
MPEKLRVSIDQLIEGVQVVAFDWTYLYLNETAVRHSRRPASDLLGRTLMECYPGIEQTPLFEALARVMHTRRAERLLNEFTYADNERRWFDLRVDAVPEGICILSLDITEHREAELRLQQAQKMEAIGQLAGGVAHDFNNMLTAILGYAELIGEQIGPDKPIGRDLREIVYAGERAAALTRQLLAFSRKQHLTPIPMSLNDVATGIVPMLRRVIGEQIRIRTSFHPDTPTVLADPVQIEQVVLNLAVNARDAMPDGGTLTIATEPATVDNSYAAEHVDLSPGRYAVLIVSDTGVGMTPAVRARIFEPFFTTKDRGKGTGMGLAAVHGIVKQLGGSIWIYSEPGRGAVFKIFLGVTDLPIPSVAERAKEGVPVGRERVLLVEDEPNIRLFAQMVLSRHGYRVIEADSAEAALAWAQDPDATIDAVVSDVGLPGLDGFQLAERLRRRYANLVVLFVSGYADPAGIPTDADLLEKPFTAHALLSRLRNALDRARH